MSYDEGRPDSAPSGILDSAVLLCPFCMNRDGMVGQCPKCEGKGVVESIPDSADLEIVPNITPELEVEITKIIPIAPGSKFVILIPQDTESDQLATMQTQLTEWWESDQPFLIAGDQFQFVKVDEHSTIPELADCGAMDCPGHEPESGEDCKDGDL